MNISLRIKIMQEVIRKQDEYIKLLTDWEKSIAGILFSHGIEPSAEQAAQGEMIRIEIAKLKSSL